MAVTPKNNDKKIRLTKHIRSSGNTTIKTTSSINVVSNTPVLSSTGVNLLSSASGSQPQGNTKNDRIQPAPNKPVVTLVYFRKSKAAKKKVLVNNLKINKSVVVQIVLWYLDSECSKHMTGDRSQLINFVQKFFGTVKFGNDHVAKIMGYEAVATTCYTQNRSIIRLHHGKTPYELLYNKLPDLSFLHVLGALCYLTNDSENLGKLQPKADIGIFIGYAPTKKAF
nr:integrase, catalytic region, zinc finger, CCHC-type, peptidase aspartic, catalytic [Tanacetum cinerariifolium]